MGRERRGTMAGYLLQVPLHTRLGRKQDVATPKEKKGRGEKKDFHIKEKKGIGNNHIRLRASSGNLGGRKTGSPRREKEWRPPIRCPS